MPLFRARPPRKGFTVGVPNGSARFALLERRYQLVDDASHVLTTGSEGPEQIRMDARIGPDDDVLAVVEKDRSTLVDETHDQLEHEQINARAGRQGNLRFADVLVVDKVR